MRVDGELAAVVAEPAPRPGLLGRVDERVVARRDRLGGRDQLGGDDARVLLVVAAPRPRSRPGPSSAKVGSSWSSISAEPLVEDPVHVADVAGVLQRRPGRARPAARSRRAGPAPPPSRRRRRGAAGRGRRGRASAATKPHSGQGSRRTQVQSLVSGSMLGWDHPGHHHGCPCTCAAQILPTSRESRPSTTSRCAPRSRRSTSSRAPLAYWEARLASTEPGDHVLVAELPDGAWWATPTRRRTARGRRTRRTREVSVYLDASARGQGLGRRCTTTCWPGCARTACTRCWR